MSGWTSKETAFWIRGNVQLLQDNLGDVPRLGKYDKATHDSLRRALSAAGYSENAIGLDDQGPNALVAMLYPAVFGDLEARFIAVAWAWYSQKRAKPIGSQALATIANGNEQLVSGGDEALTARDAEEFIGDAPVVTMKRAGLALVGIAVVLGVGTFGVWWGRSRCTSTGTLVEATHDARRVRG